MFEKKPEAPPMPVRRSTVAAPKGASMAAPKEEKPVQIEQPAATSVSSLKSVFEKKPATTAPPLKGKR